MLISARPVFYRETLSKYYSPFGQGVAIIALEVPWMAGLVAATMPIVYFMLGLSADPNVFFFHYLCTIVLGAAYLCIGTFFAHAMPT